MNKLLTAVLLSSVITLSVQAQKAEEYYVKHVEFPPNATLEQKVDMAARLIPGALERVTVTPELKARIKRVSANCDAEIIR